MNPIKDTEPIKSFRFRKEAFEYAYSHLRRGKRVALKRSKGLWSVRVMGG